MTADASKRFVNFAFKNYISFPDNPSSAILSKSGHTRTHYKFLIETTTKKSEDRKLRQKKHSCKLPQAYSSKKIFSSQYPLTKFR